MKPHTKKGAIIINIKDLTLTEVTRKIAPYITKYFADCEICGLDDNVFAESYLLGYDEVSHLLPEEHKSQFFYNGASGFLTFAYQSENFKDCEYTIMLLSNEEYSTALFLYIQEANASTGVQRDILLADFTKAGDG